MNKANLPYRKCVGIVLLNKDNKVFTAKRIDTLSDAWQMPQGGIDKEETPREAAIRELEEETSITNIEIISESRNWLSYDLPKNLIPKLWGGKYKGQQQKWFLCKFLGEESEINIKTNIPEFSEWKWTEFKKVPEIIVPFKRELYQNIVDEFSAVVDGL